MGDTAFRAGDVNNSDAIRSHIEVLFVRNRFFQHSLLPSNKLDFSRAIISVFENFLAECGISIMDAVRMELYLDALNMALAFVISKKDELKPMLSEYQIIDTKSLVTPILTAIKITRNDLVQVLFRQELAAENIPKSCEIATAFFKFLRGVGGVSRCLEQFYLKSHTSFSFEAFVLLNAKYSNLQAEQLKNAFKRAAFRVTPEKTGTDILGPRKKMLAIFLK